MFFVKVTDFSVAFFGIIISKGGDYMISKEQIAHDLAIAVVTAKLSKKNYPQSNMQLLTDYNSEFNEILRLQKLQ